MLYGMAKDGHRIAAAKGVRASCPHCRGPLIPKCGQIKIHHWAHRESKDCPYATGMTSWHYEWLQNFDDLGESGWEVEYFLDSIRFDAFNPEKKQAVEFQRTVDLEHIKTKVSICANKGIKLFWLMSPRLFQNFVYTGDFLGDRRHVLFSLRACKRKITALLDAFMGRIAFSIDFTKETCLPKYAATRVDTLAWFFHEEITPGQTKKSYMPTGIYVIKEIPCIKHPRWRNRTALFLDRRESRSSQLRSNCLGPPKRK